jgi:hypothetical protein
MKNTLGHDQVRTGQLFDWDPESSFHPCSIERKAGKSAVISIPFVRGAEQFAMVEKWFDDRDPPESLLFADNSGIAAFTGLRWAGYRGEPFKLGQLSAGVVVFGRPRSIRDEYRFVSLMSNIDGLAEFAHFQPIKSDYRTPGSALTVTVDPVEVVTWRHGGYTHRIQANAPWRMNAEGDFTATSEAFVETSKSHRASADDHITAQWPLRALLVLAHGEQLHWRGHRVRDKNFPTWMMDGSSQEPQSIELQHRRTVRDLDEQPVDRGTLKTPMFHLTDLGSRGLRRWYALYEDPAFRRAIEPTVEVINGASRFLEPRIMMTTLGLDAMGYFLDPTRANHTPLFKQILRCISATKHDWSAIGSDTGIAKAIANVNNDLKHPDRLSRPDSLTLQLIDRLATVIMRLQVFELLKLPERQRAYAARSNSVYRAIEGFALNRVAIDDSGLIMRT